MQFERSKPKKKERKVHMRPQEVHFALVENKEQNHTHIYTQKLKKGGNLRVKEATVVSNTIIC